MNILYAIQGTGNGHICRAEEIIPILQQKANVDVLISGTQSDISLPFPIKYTFNGLSFVFGKKGGIDLLETYKKSRLKRLYKEIKSLPVEDYDLVISDFEPVSSWACYIKNKLCVALSHQAAVIDKHSPRPKKIDPVGKTVLKGYAPASVKYGFHFKQYAENIYTPVIRKAVRESAKEKQGHYTVYLPAYSDKKIIKFLSRLSNVKWQVFSKHNHKAFTTHNIDVFPINNQAFISSMASSEGVLCGAGFETPAEALFLNKKLLVVPMKNQFEQHCNAAALKELGVPVIKGLKEKHFSVLQKWVETGEPINIHYPDITEELINNILTEYGTKKE